jgi:acetyl esterase/lipase
MPWEAKHTLAGLTSPGARKDHPSGVIARSTMFRFPLHTARTVALATMLLAAGAASPAEPDSSSVTSGTNSTGFSKITYCYKQAATCKIQADVYRADGSSNRPALVWIHGGALISGSRTGLHPAQLRRYLNAGFNVISIDYRLAPETKLPVIIEDLRDAFGWVRQRGPELAGIDRDRIAVVGHSAGGYLALMSGFCVQPRPKAIVAFYGYGDIAADWYARPDPFYSRQPAVPQAEARAAVGKAALSEGTTQRYRFYLYCRQNGLWPKEVAGYDPIREAEELTPYCPLRNVTKAYPPTLLLHGDKDTDVPYEQSVLMAGILERNHVEHELITMTNRGHGFDGDRRAANMPEITQAFDRTVAFLKQHTNP